MGEVEKERVRVVERSREVEGGGEEREGKRKEITREDRKE